MRSAVIRVAGRALASGMVLVALTARSAIAAECSPTQKTVRRSVVGGTVASANTAMYIYFRNAWWSGEKRSFWFNNDWDEVFRDQDKFGHFYGGYQLTRVGAGLLRFACVSPKRAVALSALHSTLFQLQIEVWDAQQKLYGFSVPDLLFNTAGAGYAVAQEHSRTLAAILPTVSYHQSLSRKLGVGENASLRLTTDYAGQTYWLSANPDDLLPASAARLWPGLLRVSLGHSVTEWRDPYTGAGRRGKRVLVASVDLDVRRLPGHHPVWRMVKEQLAFYHFPAPALQFTPSFRGVRWYQ